MDVSSSSDSESEVTSTSPTWSTSSLSPVPSSASVSPINTSAELDAVEGLLLLVNSPPALRRSASTESSSSSSSWGSCSFLPSTWYGTAIDCGFSSDGEFDTSNLAGYAHGTCSNSGSQYSPTTANRRRMYEESSRPVIGKRKARYADYDDTDSDDSVEDEEEYIQRREVEHVEPAKKRRRNPDPKPVHRYNTRHAAKKRESEIEATAAERVPALTAGHTSDPATSDDDDDDDDEGVSPSTQDWDDVDSASNRAPIVQPSSYNSYIRFQTCRYNVIHRRKLFWTPAAF
ncbi:hypothetical protein HK102_003482 [Quaeritorhiza haematococci]|nr:hypothetical protein HK102_003482 [Quaeritorhiza haematococci]